MQSKHLVCMCVVSTYIQIVCVLCLLLPAFLHHTCIQVSFRLEFEFFKKTQTVWVSEWRVEIAYKTKGNIHHHFVLSWCPYILCFLVITRTRRSRRRRERERVKCESSGSVCMSVREITRMLKSKKEGKGKKQDRKFIKFKLFTTILLCFVCFFLGARINSVHKLYNKAL